MVSRIKVMIVDDSAPAREGLESILSANTDIEVVGKATDGLEAIAGVMEHRPDIVLMDSQMPTMDGAEATRHIKEDFPQVKVLFLTVHPNHIEAGLAAGADAALLKDSGRQELLSAIRRLAENR